MSDLFIRGGGDPLLPAMTAGKVAPSKSGADKSFGAVLNDALRGVNQLQLNAERAITDIQVNKTGSVHEAMIALEKADISFRAMMQVRNKLLDAYQEVMRMSV